MGNCTSSKETHLDTNMAFHKTGMREPWSDDYENHFEKDLYYAINVLRHSPSKYIGPVKDLPRLFPKAFTGGDKNFIKQVCATLSLAKPVPQVLFDKSANAACRANNKKVVARNETDPSKGGNIEEYQTTLNVAGKQVIAEEFTVHNWQHSAAHLIAYQVADFYKNNPSCLVVDKKAAQKQMKAVEKEAKEAEKRASQQQDDTPGENPDVAISDKREETFEVPEPQPQGEKVPPPMDARVQKLGISFKGHANATNLIQFLYVMDTANSMI